MKKIQMKEDVHNSFLGFGCMRFPTKHDRIDREEATKLLDYAYDHGVNHFDVAYPYHGGESELFLGDYLKKYKREDYTLSTKMPIWKVEKYEDFDALLDEQLERLQVDYFDFYLLHALNKKTYQNIVDNGIFDWIKKIKQTDKVRYIGFSFHDDKDTFQEIANAYQWDFALLQINYIDYDTQQGIEGYELLTSKGIPVWVMEPLKGGRLATLAPDILSHYKEVNPDDNAAKWAFRWVHSLPNVKLVLSGMSTMEQVEDNINIFKDIEPLNDKELQVVDHVKEIINNRVKVQCTYCNYCMPCPVNVNIPKNFKIYNDGYMYNNQLRASESYRMGLKVDERAVQCIECNQCMEHCPQDLQIPDLLGEVAEYFKEVV